MEKRSLYTDKIDAKLIRYNTKLARIKSKVAKVPVDMKPEYLSQVVNIEKKCDEFMKKYDQLRICSEQDWEDVDGVAKKTWNELEKRVEEAIENADVFILKKMVRDNPNEYLSQSRYFKFCDNEGFKEIKGIQEKRVVIL